ncbi:MAG: PilT protein domain protein [Caulobacteraceae bacterium]|nr:PilT protein domain protein [Caulobacteraceae bacterium]
MAGSFIDTNILVYLAVADTAKAGRARTLVEEGGAISVQVLNEFANVCRRRVGLSWDQTHGVLAVLREVLTVHPLTLETHETGLRLATGYGLSIYDAMIVAAALISGCDRLWSEDMQDGLVIERQLRISNPFRND